MDLSQIDFEKASIVGILGGIVVAFLTGLIVPGHFYKKKCDDCDKSDARADEAIKLAERLTQGWLPPQRRRP